MYKTSLWMTIIKLQLFGLHASVGTSLLAARVRYVRPSNCAHTDKTINFNTYHKEKKHVWEVNA